MVPRWAATAGHGTSAFFALNGQPYVSLGHSAATPQVANWLLSPERAALVRGQCRMVPPFQGLVPGDDETQGGAARLGRYALPWADMGLPLQGEEPRDSVRLLRVRGGKAGGLP